MEKIEYISKEEIEEEILRNKQLHKEICVFILNDQKEVLLQKKSPNKKAYPNRWALLTGRVELNETFKNAAIREINEEVGLKINKENLNLFSKRTFTNDNIHYEITYFYYIKSNLKESDFIIQKEELSQVKWINIDVVIDMIEKQQDNIVINKNKSELLKYLKNLNGDKNA